MKLFLRGEYLTDVESNEEAEEIIKEIQQKEFVVYQEFKAIYAATINELGKIRPKGFIETNPEYLEYVSQNHGGVIVGMEKVGHMVLKDGFDSVYIFNSNDTSAGYKVDGKAVPLSLLPLKAALLFPKRDEFTIE